MNSNNTTVPDNGASDDHLINSITCSMASRNDLPKVRALLSQNDLPEEDVGKHIDHFMLAWDNGTLAGTVGVELLGSEALLRSLCVSTSYRNRGIASELCNRIEAYARNAGVNKLYLLTTTARDFFARRGYAFCSPEIVSLSVQGTSEFRFLCPCTAECMVRMLV